MKQAQEKTIGLMGHITQLRTRFIRTGTYTLAGLIGATHLYPQISVFLTQPIDDFLRKIGSRFML